MSRYVLRLGQAAQKQQRPRRPNRKLYLEIKEAEEWALSNKFLMAFCSRKTKC